MQFNGTAVLDRPEAAQVSTHAASVSTLDLRWMDVPHLAVCLYSSAMPDRLPPLATVGRSALVEWGEQGLAKIGPACVMRAADLLCALAYDADIAFVFGQFLPRVADVAPSELRSSTARSAAWHLVAHLDSENYYDLSQVTQ